jgi:hypothetical protein
MVPFNPNIEPVVEVGRIVDAVLVQDQRIGQGADLEQAMPVGVVACQARDLQAHHDPGATHADIAHQALKAFAVLARGARLTEVGIDHDDLLAMPAQGERPLLESVLTPCALGVLEHLAQRGLADIQIGLAFGVPGLNLTLGIGSHAAVLR